MVRLAPGAGVPHKRPVPNMRRLSGEKGSVSGGTLSHNILALVPRPPRCSSVNFGSLSTLSMFPRDKSISKLKPVSPYLTFYPQISARRWPSTAQVVHVSLSIAPCILYHKQTICQGGKSSGFSWLPARIPVTLSF